MEYVENLEEIKTRRYTLAQNIAAEEFRKKLNRAQERCFEPECTDCGKCLNFTEL